MSEGTQSPSRHKSQNLGWSRGSGRHKLESFPVAISRQAHVSSAGGRGELGSHPTAFRAA
jgi:hypothetical protein